MIDIIASSDSLFEFWKYSMGQEVYWFIYLDTFLINVC